MKAAVVVLSDPKSGGDKALGRVFNALAATYDFKRRGAEVTLLFQGAGTRWVGELTKPEHPAAALYETVQDKVAGISCGCADVFGGAEEAEKASLDLIKNNPVPGTSGLPSLAKLISDGYSTLIF